MTTNVQLPSLADEGEPLRLKDGTLVYPSGKRVSPSEQELAKPVHVEVPAPSKAQVLIARTRKRIADLPAMPKSMNTVSVILGYTLFGLDDQDIAIATGLSVDQIGRIRMSEAYGILQDEATKAILANDADSVRNVLAAKAQRAAQRMAAFVDSENDSIAFAAANNVLDRTGHRPVDVHEHKIAIESELRIVHVKREDIPSIGQVGTE